MRYVLDFGAGNTGLTPTFSAFKNLQSLADVTPPAIAEIGSGQYYFDYSPFVGTAVVFKAAAAGIELSDVIASSNPVPNRVVLDYGSANTGLTPTFPTYKDAATLTSITPPGVVEIGVGLYYFDVVFGSYTSIVYAALAAGIQLTGVVSTPTSSLAAGGGMTLLALRNLVRQESDTENDPHISDAELTTFINMSRYELYDLLIASFGEDYYTANATITTDGINDQFPLPDGVLYGGAPAFYKGELVEANVYGGDTGWVSLQKFNLHEKNKFRLLNYYTIMAQRLPRYRVVGATMMYAPLPVSGITTRLWYAPKLSALVADTDVAEDFSGWLEYVVVDAAIKCVSKQERDPSVLLLRKKALKDRIEVMAQNRDLGQPNTVTEVQTDTFPFGAPFSVFGTGPWGGV